MNSEFVDGFRVVCLIRLWELHPPTAQREISTFSASVRARTAGPQTLLELHRARARSKQLPVGR